MRNRRADLRLLSESSASVTSEVAVDDVKTCLFTSATAYCIMPYSTPQHAVSEVTATHTVGRISPLATAVQRSILDCINVFVCLHGPGYVDGAVRERRSLPSIAAYSHLHPG